MAEQRFRALLKQNAEHPGLLLYLALLRPAPADAERNLRQAAGLFHQRGDFIGEGVSRLNLVACELDEGRLEEAPAEIERAATATAMATGRPDLVAQATVARAKYFIARGDFATAGGFLDAVKTEYRKASWLVMSCNLHIETGQLGRASEECTRLATDAKFKPFDRATGLYCQARILLEREVELPKEVGPTLVEKTARAALALAEPPGAAQPINPYAAAKVHWLLARIAKDPATGRAEVERCLAVAPGDAERLPCESALARIDAATTRARPLAAPLPEDPVLRSQYLGTRMRLSAATQPFALFRRDARSDLAEIELLRSLQASPGARVGVFSSWSDDFSWYAGYLLREAGRRRECPSCVAEAFAVTERARARVLREALEASQPKAVLPTADPDRLPRIQQAQATVRQRVADTTLPASEHDYAVDDLAHLTAEESALRRQPLAPVVGAAPQAGDGRDVRDTGVAELSQVQTLLRADEAMLSFQIAPWQDWTGDFGGGAWVVAVTRGGAIVHELRDLGREVLRRDVEDLVDQRASPLSGQHVAMHRQLLATALAALPPGIRQLIVVPDDYLWALPFAALTAGRGGPPLVAGYRITIVPSATLWAKWRAAPAAAVPKASRTALVLADPRPPSEEEVRTFRAAGISLPSEPLPGARQEADSLMRYLGWGVERWVGSAATKDALEDHPRRFAVLHFAAHSIADPLDDGRSGIWLSSAEGRAGFLTVAEIARLRLDDRLVVLSSCSSNSGPVVHGEGVMSLARAFFAAHARTVVASLWPQYDTDAAALMSDFYRHLGAGDSVAAALQAAQLDRLHASPGPQFVAWAGFVVLGDGDLVPFPDGRQPWPAWLSPTPSGVATAVGTLLAVVGLLWLALVVARRCRVAVAAWLAE